MGNKKFPTFVPAEVCEIFPGQMAKKRLDSTQNSDMMSHAKRDPEQIRMSIKQNAFKVLELENNSTLVSVMFEVQGLLRLIPIEIFWRIFEGRNGYCSRPYPEGTICRLQQ